MGKWDRRRIGYQYWGVAFTNAPEGDSGLCMPPNTKHKKILIDSEAKNDDFELLSTLLHEALHAACWSLDEEYVDMYSRDAAKLAIDMGFKRTGCAVDTIPFIEYNEAMHGSKATDKEPQK